MKSVKLAAVSSLFAVLLAFPLAGCTAEVVPSEPTEVTVRATTSPGGGNGGGEAGNEQVVGTSHLRNGAPTPWTEPLPNPWHGGPVEGIGDLGILPNVETPSDPGAPPSGPQPHVHRPAEDPDTERYNGPKGTHPW